MMEIRKFRFKIIVIGDSQVGKTTLIKKFTQGSFDANYAKTTGLQASVFDSEIEGNRIRLLIWHIAAQEEFHYLYPRFFRNTRAAIIIFSLEDTEQGRESFNHISNWHEQVMKHCGDVPVYLFGNKFDLVDEDKFDESQIKKLVEEYNLQGYYLTSTITGRNIVKALNDISISLYNKYKAIPPSEPKYIPRTNKKEKKRQYKKRQ